MLLNKLTPPAESLLRFPPRLALGVTLLASATYLLVFLAGIPPRWRELSALCQEGDCLPFVLTPADAVALDELGLSIAIYASYQVGVEVVVVALLALLAGLIVWRRGDSGVALLTAMALVGFGASVIVESDVALARAHPALAWPVGVLEALAFLPFVWLLVAFPNGRFVPRWGWLALLGVGGVMAASALFGPPFAEENPLRLAVLVICMAVVVAGVAAQVHRYRRVSGPLERQQSKWVLLALAGVAAGMITYILFFELFPLPAGQARVMFSLVATAVLVALLLSLPVSLALSILRYRLWDIDILIRRTLIYGALTATLVFVYFGVVVALQSLLRAVTGEGQSEISVVLSTLTIAALFVPVRRRLQEAIDRRFYRQRYDAAQVLSEFGSGLRDEVELDLLVDRLLSTVNGAMQPHALSLWLREAPTGDQADVG